MNNNYKTTVIVLLMKFKACHADHIEGTHQSDQDGWRRHGHAPEQEVYHCCPNRTQSKGIARGNGWSDIAVFGWDAFC